MTISGCQAIQGCERKHQCARYHRFLHSTPFDGFNAHQTCRVSEFTENTYPHFVPIHEAAMEELVRLSEEMGLYELKKENTHATTEVFSTSRKRITVPETVKAIPLEPTPSMIEAGAQRLASWQDDSQWPEDWTSLQIHQFRNDAERVWRSMWLAAQENSNES